MTDYRGEFENWCDKWDEAQGKGIFDDMPEQEPNSILGFGTAPREEEQAPQDFTPQVSTPQVSSEEKPELMQENSSILPTKADLDSYVNKWEKAQKEGIFDSMPSVKSQEPEVGSSAQDAYWKNFEREAKQNEFMQEDHAGTPTSKADLAHQSKDIARAANPVYHHTAGMDQELEPWTPNWTDGKELAELAELKVDLYDLECECGKKDALGESGASIQSRIKTMWNKLNQLSNDLTPNRFKEILD